MKTSALGNRAAAVAAAMVFGAGVTASGGAAAELISDGWRFRAVIYMWMPKITGSATFPRNDPGAALAAVDAEFDMSFPTILDHLKMTGMGTLEVQKGRWGAFTDVVYLNVGSTSTTTRDGTIDGVPLPVGVTLNTGLDLKSLIWTLAGSYRVQATRESELDVFVGARMLSIEPRLTYDFSADVGPFIGPGAYGRPNRQGNGLERDRRRQGSCRLRRQSRMVHPVLPRHRSRRFPAHLAGRRGHRVRVPLGRRDRSPTATSTTTSSRAATSNDLTVHGPLLGVTLRW